MFNDNFEKETNVKKRVIAIILAMSMLLGISLFAFAFENSDDEFDTGLYIEGENPDDAGELPYGGQYGEDKKPPYGVYPPVGGGCSRRLYGR